MPHDPLTARPCVTHNADGKCSLACCVDGRGGGGANRWRGPKLGFDYFSTATGVAETIYGLSHRPVSLDLSAVLSEVMRSRGPFRAAPRHPGPPALARLPQTADGSRTILIFACFPPFFLNCVLLRCSVAHPPPGGSADLDRCFRGSTAPACQRRLVAGPRARAAGGGRGPAA